MFRDLFNYGKVKTGEKATTLEIALPGIKRSEIKVRVRGNRLTIDVPKSEYTRYNIYTYDLLSYHDVKGIRGKMRSGILSIEIPMKDELYREVEIE